MRPHKKLLAWQESIFLVEAIYEITKNFPDSEKFGLIAQLRRAAVSIPANISEGAARNSKKEFLHFLHIASGSLSEVDTLLIVSVNLKLIQTPIAENAEFRIEKVGSLLNGLIRKLKSELK